MILEKIYSEITLHFTLYTFYCLYTLNYKLYTLLYKMHKSIQKHLKYGYYYFFSYVEFLEVTSRWVL